MPELHATPGHDNPSVLGSSRRAQDDLAALVAQAIAGWPGVEATGAVSLDAYARAVVAEMGRAPVAPSQGQEIPADQLHALLTEALTRFTPDAQSFLATSGYRIGFAAALGYEITIDEGRVGVGDRPELDDADDPLTMADELRVHLRAVADQRDKAQAEVTRLRAELRDARNDLLDIRGTLSPNGYPPVTPFPLVPTVAPAVAWLVEQLQAVRPVTVPGAWLDKAKRGEVTAELLTPTADGCPGPGEHQPHSWTSVGPNDLLIRFNCTGAGSQEAPSA